VGQRRYHPLLIHGVAHLTRRIFLTETDMSKPKNMTPEQEAQWKERNRARDRARKKAARIKDAEKVREYARIHYKKNSEKAIARVAAYKRKKSNIRRKALGLRLLPLWDQGAQRVKFVKPEKHSIERDWARFVCKRGYYQPMIKITGEVSYNYFRHILCEAFVFGKRERRTPNDTYIVDGYYRASREAEFRLNRTRCGYQLAGGQRFMSGIASRHAFGHAQREFRAMDAAAQYKRQRGLMMSEHWRKMKAEQLAAKIAGRERLSKHANTRLRKIFQNQSASERTYTGKFFEALAAVSAITNYKHEPNT
jgi:hypothetical protein